jgi:hypothetical protein
MMFKSSFLVSVILAAGVPACHHDHPPANPATAETTSTGGMTATAEPGNTTHPSNSDSIPNAGAAGTALPSTGPSTEDPNRTIPGGKEPLTNDPDRTGSPGTAGGSGAPTGSGTDTGSDANRNAPDTTVPTAAQDTGSGSNTGTGSGSNTTRRTRGATTGKSRSGSGNGSSDGSAGSGSDVPR